MTQTFVVDRKSLAKTRWVHREATPLDEGAVRLAIELFALTSNNITYAAFGDAMNYWAFFPTGDASTGCIPAWGFAKVIESRCAAVEVGERFYGYYPTANEVDVLPARINAAGFSDGAPHRRELHAVYNRYLRCAADPLYDPRREAEQALLRPLFITSFLIDDFLGDQGFFGADTVVLSSASSKTAYGTAFCLGRRRGTSAAVRVIGLTSAANAAFTRALGCYDEVFTYDHVPSLPADRPAVYVDMSGSAPGRAAVHEHLGAQLRYSCSVGGTHWTELGSGKGLAGPRPVLFFAPAQIERRMSDWGRAGLEKRTAEAWHAFMVPVSGASPPWLRVVHGTGRAALEEAYKGLLGGGLPPQEGHVLTV